MKTLHLMTRSRTGKLAAALLLTIALAVTAAALPACGNDDVTYSYFVVQLRVSPTVDSDNYRKAANCVLTVEGADMDQVALKNCSFGFNTDYNLGVADFSTSTTSGQVRFVLSLKDPNLVEIARGESAYQDILPGETVTTEVIAYPAPGHDGGMMMGSTDGGMDPPKAPTTDAATGTNDDGGTDAVAD